MKRTFRTLAAATVITLAVAAIEPAHAQGSAIDPNGFWGWLVALFSDEGVMIDPNG